MGSLVIGIVAVFAILYGFTKGELNTYFQIHSVIIVVLGTFAVMFMATPSSALKSLVRAMRGLFQKERQFSDYEAELMQLAANRHAVTDSSHPLIGYAIQLWAQGTEADLIVPLLSQKRRELESRATDATHALKNLAKYPPALGMTGTVMGMITLFSNLDSNKDRIGTSLSIAMTATFLGLVLANMIISPLSDRLHIRQINQSMLLDNIFEILLLINRDEATALIQEEMKERAA